MDAFIKHTAESGLNVFTNFDANNDPRNHVAVAEAVHKYGQHYQAALSWAVVGHDPTIYNVKWAVGWFKRIVRDLQPHSLYVKDPSGVLTPEMAGALAREIKGEFPDLPLIFHTHYQTGFAYTSYIEAMRNGANGVEASLGFPDGAGQPYSLSLLRMAEDFGLDTGNPDKAAWTAVSDFCNRQLRPLYPSANVVRTPNIAVEQTGVAGGQRSILDKELIDAGQANLISKVDSMVQTVRKEGGLVCQVTPVADSYAREAMRRIRGGSDTKGFTPGYAQILYGELGSTKEPVHAGQRCVALNERAARKLVEMRDAGRLSSVVYDAFQGFDTKGLSSVAAAALAMKPKPLASTPLGLWRAKMDALAAPVVAAQRQEEVEARLAELQAIQKQPELLAPLNAKIAQASRMAKPTEPEYAIHTVADRIKVLQAELAALQAVTSQTASGATQHYEHLLTLKATEATYKDFIAMSPLTQGAFDSGALTLPQVKEILSHCGVITCSSSLLLVPAQESSRLAIEAFEAENVLGVLDSPLKAAENTTLWSCFSRAAIPNLFPNFLENYYTGDIAGAFPPLFKGDKPAPAPGTPARRATLSGAIKAQEARSQFLYRHVHKQIEAILAEDATAGALLCQVKDLRAEIFVLKHRAARWALAPLPEEVDNAMDGCAQVSEDTKQKLVVRIDQMNAEVAKLESQLQSIVCQSIEHEPAMLLQTFPRFSERKSRVEFAPLVQLDEEADNPAEEAEMEQEEFGMARAALQQIIERA